MAEYRLKPGQEKFQVVDGPRAGAKFQPGKTYNDIPPGEVERFEEVAETAKATVPARKKTAEKEAEQ